MNQECDFIIKDGLLENYRGSSPNVIIPEGIHTIDMLAFSRDRKANIESIQFPKSLETIEDWAFDHCEKLTRIVIPANVKKIGKGSFNWCRALSEVVIEGNPKIGDGAFSWSPWEENEFRKARAKINGNVLSRVYPELTEYTIPSTIKVIGRDAFKNCKVKEIVIPHGVTKLDICAFACSSIERISLPDTLKVIESYAFSNCENLTELIVPKSVTDIDRGAFQELPNCVLTILNESDDEKLFRISDHAFAFGQLIPRIKEVRVPYGSVAMRYALKAGLKVVTFPCSPKKFGKPKKYEYVDDMFCCSRSTLHEFFGQQDVVYVPEGIRTIGAKAFECSKVKKVYLPRSVKTIDKDAFDHCQQLEAITGEGVKQIERHAFHCCKNLKRVEFPNLKRCFDISFENCNSLKRKNIIIPEDAEIIMEAEEPWMCGCGCYHITRTPFTPIKTVEKTAPHKRGIDFDKVKKQAIEEFTNIMEEQK